MRTYLLLIALLISCSLMAQGDFKKQIATARSSYSAGKLEDAHFALQQAMQELDLIIGKEVLKLLPAKMDSLAMNPKDDKVAASLSFIGTTIMRSYGTNGKFQVEIINNSPMLGPLNSLLSSGMFGGMVRDENTKTVKIQGYKARLEKKGMNDNGKPNYELQMPFNSALISVKANGFEESDVLNGMNLIPFQDIARLIQ